MVIELEEKDTLLVYYQNESQMLQKEQKTFTNENEAFKLANKALQVCHAYIYSMKFTHMLLYLHLLG